MRLLRCNNLHESDFYFETILAASLDIDLLGDIELSDEEFNHLTELISKELKKPGFFISDSLSIAVFLVWTGILHYKDNFWGPVYKFLELPTAQVKWQRHLGDIFIQTLKKHRLPYLYLEGKLRYIIPILTHGYIPNYYLDSFFNDVLVQLYIDRKNTGITDNLVNLDEIKHIVSNWQHEYKIHQVLQKQKAELESQEKDADIILEILKNKDYLIRLNELSDELIDSDVINKLLALPEDWLIDTEVKIKNLEEICTLLDDALETSTEINNRQNELRELNQKIGETASHIMDYWNETLIDYVLNIPSKSIEETVHEYNAAKRPFQGSLGWLLRLILRRRFKRIDLCKRELEQYLSNLPVRKNILEDPPLILSKKINIIQKLIKIRNRIEKELEVIRESEKELAALSQEKNISRQDITFYKNQLSSLKNELAEYKMALIKLGKGSIEKGMEECSKQRNIRNEIELIKKRVSSHIDTDELLKNLHLMDKFKNEDSVISHLTNIGIRKAEIEKKLEHARNPLYVLNESTRTFLLEGGDISAKFIYYSMLLLQKLDQGEGSLEGICLPSRIINRMKRWWDSYGQNMLNEEKQLGYWLRTGDFITLRRPIVKLDTLNGSIKAELPKQLLKEMTDAAFIVHGESGTKWKKEVIIKQIRENQFQTESVVIDLAQPESKYRLEFKSEEFSREWEIKGLAENEIYLLFNLRGELIDGEQLPTEAAYVVVPAGSRVEPDEAVRERGYMSGCWSFYEYCYLNLENTDVVLIEYETKVAILKQKTKLEPRLIGGNKSTILTTKENVPIYMGSLPEIVFTPDDIEKLNLYGVRLDCLNGTYYLPLEKLENFNPSAKDVHIPLSVVADEFFGSCRVSLIYRQNVIWSQDFITLPHLNLTFNQDIYWPQMEDKDKGQLEISSGCKFIFSAYPPASIIDSTAKRTLIEFNIKQQYIYGELCFYQNQEEICSFEVCIEIPCIRWRKNRNDIWRVEVEELWHEDLDQIQVKLSPSISGLVTLSLEDNRQVLSNKAKTEIISFNLRQFSDSLRESNKPVHTLSLSLENSIFLSFPLIQVRTHWQVKNVRVEQKFTENECTIRVIWEDIGKASSRILRFWPLNTSKINVFEQHIPDNVTYLEIVQSRDKFPAGMYRLQFDLDDPWAADEILMPDSDSENCFDLKIGSLDEIYVNVIKNGLVINSFEWERRKIPAGRNYWIDRISFSPEFEGDKLLKGTVYTADEEGNIHELDYNPVSFYLELDNNYKLPFLIDRDKDGVMYCIKCKELFWEDAHRECGKQQVIFPDYINVLLRSE